MIVMVLLEQQRKYIPILMAAHIAALLAILGNQPSNTDRSQKCGRFFDNPTATD